MKHTLANQFKLLFSHLRLTVALSILLLLSIGSVVYIAVTIQASDVLVFTHYTAYGITHFYRNAWSYFLTFIAFIVLILLCFSGLAFKLLRQDREALALLFCWIGVAMVILATITYLRIDLTLV